MRSGKWGGGYCITREVAARGGNYTIPVHFLKCLDYVLEYSLRIFYSRSFYERLARVWLQVPQISNILIFQIFSLLQKREMRRRFSPMHLRVEVCLGARQACRALLLHAERPCVVRGEEGRS